MTHARRHLPSLTAAVIATLLLVGCGSDDPAAPDTPVELEDQLGFSESGSSNDKAASRGASATV